MTETLNQNNGSLETVLNSLFQHQVRNNRARTRDLRAMATDGFRQIFDLAPTLIHYNHPQLPGYLEDPDTPGGLLFYDRWLERRAAEDSGPWKLQTADSPIADNPAAGNPAADNPAADNPAADNPVVECLVLIGSSGSVGHTAQSDLDYWVCYNPRRLQGRRLELFREKLQALTQWAMDEHKTEAHFYPVDLSVLSLGRLENSEGESDGEVAPMLLVEELFRTILYVAGRYPLWCVWPEELSEEEYRRQVPRLAPLDWTGEPPFFIDLGFPSKPKPQEYLASAMWLTCKSEDDPFKGLLKIMPIMEAVDTGFASPLLCDIVKKRILYGDPAELPVDPYIITVERVIDFVSRKLSQDQVDLVEEAACLKVLGRSAGEADLTRLDCQDPKKRILAKWIKEWNWTPEKFRHLGSYDKWSNLEQLSQVNELIKLLFSCYMIIANTLMTQFPGQVDAQNEVLAPMAARMLGRLGGAEVTVELLPSHILRQNLSSQMVFQRQENGWSIYHWPQGEAGGAEYLSDRNRIYQTARAAKAAAWLVSNQLFSADLTVALAETGSEPLTVPLLEEYLVKLAELFPPIKFHTLDPRTIWQTQAQGPVLLTFNFEEPAPERTILTMDVIYRTGWGEMRHQFRDVRTMKTEADKIFELGRHLVSSCGVTSPGSLVFLAGSQPQMSRAFTNLVGAARSLFRSMGPNPAASLIDL